MEYFSLIMLVFTIHLLAVMSPGPDFVMVLKNALQYDRKTAVYTSLGISLGIGVHILYSLAGIAYLLQTNPNFFKLIKIFGALYITYIGLSSFLTPNAPLSIQKQSKNGNLSPLQAVKTGFLTNILNPKASLFFLSIFSLIIPPDTPHRILAFISLMLMGVTFLWFSLVAVIFTHRRIIKHYEKYETYLIKFFGLILISLGIAIFFEI